MSTAQFKIGTSPYSARGFDATNGQVLQLQLEDSPALDIQSCVYVQVGKTKGAPDLVFGNGGVASPPTAAVSCTCPASGAHSYSIECRTNGGAPVKVAGKLDYSQNVKQRIVSIRTATANVRKILVAESTQYSPTGGWSDAQNEMADQVEQAVSTAGSVSSSAAKLAVVAASTTNIDLSGTVASVNGISISVNDRVALFGQTAGAENGLYVKGVDNKLTRSLDADSSAEVTPGIVVPVQIGTNRGSWVLVTTGTIALDTTPLRFILQGVSVDARRVALADGSTDDIGNLQSVSLVAPEIVYSASATAYAIGSDGTVGTASSTHTIPAGATIAVGSGKTLTLRGQVNAGPHAIFTGPGTVLLPDMQEVLANWWNTPGDGVVDDALGWTKAIASKSSLGGTVVGIRPTNGFKLKTPIVIGTRSTNSQGIKLVSKRMGKGAFNDADFTSVAALPKGAPMILAHNCLGLDIDGLCLDGNGQADYGILYRSDSFNGLIGGGFANTSWFTRIAGVTVRNVNIAEIQAGEPDVEPSVAGDTFTATGHPLINGDPVYFWPVFSLGPDSALPSPMVLDSLYYVVQATANTFKLSATIGGSAITTTDSGIGRWLVSKVSLGDQSDSEISQCFPGNVTVAGSKAIARFVFKSYETFCQTVRGCQSQGPIALGVSFSAVAATDLVTPASGAWANGDCVLVWPYLKNGSDVLPAPLANDTRYYVVNASGGSFKLATTPGGSAIDVTTAGTGTFLITKLVAPYYVVAVHDGDVVYKDSTSVSHYETVRLTGRPGSSEGFALAIRNAQSQDWRLLGGDSSGLTLVQQVGGALITGGGHQDIFGGSQDSIRWNVSSSSSNSQCPLTVVGGKFYRNLFVGSASGPIKLVGAEFVTDGFSFVAAPSGHTEKISGDWIESGVLKSRAIPAPVVAHTYAGTVALDFSKSSTHTVPVTGAVTFTFANALSGQVVAVSVTQDATGGRAVTWPGSAVFAVGDDTADLTANARTTWLFRFDGTFYRCEQRKRSALNTEGIPTSQASDPSTLAERDASANLYAAAFKGAGIAHVISDIGFVDLGDPAAPHGRFTASGFQTFKPLIGWDESVATPNLTAAAVTSDVAANPLAINDCAPFVSATGTHRDNGGITVNIHTAVAGGTQKGLVIKVAGVTRLDTSGTKPTIAGALSTVADAPAKAVLTSIIAALKSGGGADIAIDGTT